MGANPVIAGQVLQDYLATMLSAVTKLLVLVALALMPLGMAPVAAAPVQSIEAASDGMPCGDHSQPADEHRSSSTHCTACTALPAIDAPAPTALLKPQAPAQIAPVHTMASIEPELATPHPRS